MFVVALQMSEENKWMTMDDVDGEREREKALSKRNQIDIMRIKMRSRVICL